MLNGAAGGSTTTALGGTDGVFNPHRAPRPKRNPPMLTHSVVISGSPAVKSFVEGRVQSTLDLFWDFLRSQDVRLLEQRCRAVGDAIAYVLLHASIADQLRDAALKEIAEAGLTVEDIRFRDDQDYQVKLTSTLGPVVVPGFAWRDERGERSVTHRAGIDAVHPLRGRCRSTPLLLEWECRFAQQMTFRLAADEMLWASGGHADIEDSRLSAHAVAIGGQIDRSFLYKKPEDIKKILKNRATRRRGGGPIVYISTDATALRRYVDETSMGAWKLSNGTRVWCVDQFTGEAIHLGGEYTWQDSYAVVEALSELDRLRILPRDGAYGDDCQAVICVLSDGSSWIRERFQAWFKTPVGVLDVWHLIERLSKDGKTMLGDESAAWKAFSAAVTREIFGPKTTQSTDTPKPRRGRKNGRRRAPKPLPAGAGPTRDEACALIALIAQLEIRKGTEDVRETLLAFLTANADRLAYRRLRWLGICIGSGAMESLHRTGVQCRVKLPGAVWTEESSTAIFNLRMMKLAGRWKDFWAGEGLPRILEASFPRRAAAAPLGARKAA